MKITGIIPARFGSSRFPGKPLALIQGKSMLQRVYEQAEKAKKLSNLIVATDDLRIKDHALGFGATVVMTREDHPSGTDRCYEAYVNSGVESEYIINIQGDEPFLDPNQIDSLVDVCDGKVEIATQMALCNDHSVLFDRGEVKIVVNKNREALYFSRSVIPHIKGMDEANWNNHYAFFRHVGMYVYRADILAELVKLQPSSLEVAESLEQLRWLENGFKIQCVETTYDSHGIDLPEDIEKVLKLMSAKN
jgi:3-deoxy-manno-octulosonate cytidylyltransferase (CMP-KDO synthetase)